MISLHTDAKSSGSYKYFHLQTKVNDSLEKNVKMYAITAFKEKKTCVGTLYSILDTAFGNRDSTFGNRDSTFGISSKPWFKRRGRIKAKCHSKNLLIRLFVTFFFPSIPHMSEDSDPFQCRLDFLALLTKLNASQHAIQKVANYAMRHRRLSEDLYSCLIEQLEQVRNHPF